MLNQLISNFKSSKIQINLCTSKQLRFRKTTTTKKPNKSMTLISKTNNTKNKIKENNGTSINGWLSLVTQTGVELKKPCDGSWRGGRTTRCWWSLCWRNRKRKQRSQIWVGWVRDGGEGEIEDEGWVSRGLCCIGLAPQQRRRQR